jgi:hypothetical protein
MHTKQGEDPSTHLKYDMKLWLTIGSYGRPNMNQVYDISMTIT